MYNNEIIENLLNNNKYSRCNINNQIKINKKRKINYNNDHLKRPYILSHSLLAGSIAGIFSESILHPFDTISLRIKVQNQNDPKYLSYSNTFKTIFKEEGLRGFFGGLETTLLFAPIISAVYFSVYETMKAYVIPKILSQKYEYFGYFISGATTELAISAISVPMDVIKCRLQLGRNPNNASGGWIKHTHNYRNTVHAVSSIIQNEGLKGLYVGYTACLAVDVCFSAFSFLFYETSKKIYIQRKIKNEKDYILTSGESILCGSIAGGTAAFISNPLDVITVRLMTQERNKNKNLRKYPSIKHCFMNLIKAEGMKGLYKGSLARVMNITPATGITFGIYETLRQYLYNGKLEELDISESF